VSQIQQIKETSDFTKRITEEVTRNISQHIIQNLDAPLKESKKQIEERAKVIICRLDEDDRVLEAHKEHRTARGFLSRTREEREFELYEAKISALSEDNESLQSQLSELTRTHNASKEQITKLQEGRTKWQQKCLSMMAKRPREEDIEPGLAKRNHSGKSSRSCTGYFGGRNNEHIRRHPFISGPLAHIKHIRRVKHIKSNQYIKHIIIRASTATLGDITSRGGQ
jgi:hypothetical protein